MIDTAITAQIAAAKTRLLAGGLLQEVEWGRPGERDVMGRRTFTYTPLDALITDRSALDRGTFDTDRSDDTVLVIFDPLAITDEHTFRWGEEPHTYSVKAVDGILQDEDTGTRYASEVILIR